MIDNFQGSSGPGGPQVSHQQYVQDAGGDIIGEENKLEDNFIKKMKISYKPV